MWIRGLILVLLCCATPLQAADAWRPLGPGGGIPMSAAADPLVPGRLFAIWSAGGEGREIYRRDSGAVSWSLANRGLEGGRPQLLAFHPTRPGTLWAAAQPHSIYQSTDAGASWQLRFASRNGQQAFGLWAIQQGRRVTLLGWFGFVEHTARLFRSTDAGRSWTAVDGFRGPVVSLPASGTVFAPGPDGRTLFASQDAGATWRPRGTLPGDVDADPIFAFTAVPGRRPGLLISFALAGFFRSLDQGVTWLRVGPAGPGPTSVVAVPRALWAVFHEGLYQSTDGGATWRPRTTAGLPPRPASLVADPTNGALYAVSVEQRQLHQSRDGGSNWTLVAPRGVQQFVALDFAWHPLDPRVQGLLSAQLTVIGTVGDTSLLSTEDGGATWRSSGFEAFAFDPTDPHVLYGGSRAVVSVSRDGGASWTVLRNGPATALAHSGRALFMGGCGIARSADDGGHWEDVLPCQVPPGPNFPNGGFLLPRRLLAHPTDPDVIWAEVAESFTIDTFVRTVLYGSFDGGTTWVRRERSFPTIELAPGQPDTVWSIGSIVERSDDRGLTWRLVRFLLSEDAFDLAVDPLDPDRIYLAGFFAEISRDGGATWDRAFDVQSELAPWGTRRQSLVRLFLHPTLPGRVAAAPGLGLLLRRAPL